MAANDVTLVMVGDAYIQRPDADSAFAPVAPFLKGADIGFCNLETVVADATYLAPDDHTTYPRTDESVLGAYLRAGFNVVNIANNPVMYHGRRAFLRSLDVLDAAGLVHGGGGRDLAEARRPAVLERKGTRVAFVCRTSVGRVDAGATADRAGVARFRVMTEYERPGRVDEVPGAPPIIRTYADAEDQEALREDIQAARQVADVVVVSWHWGVSPASQGTGDLCEYQIEMGRFAVEAGADMVVGHHSHLPQPIEVYHGKPIIYSIANYVHDMGSFGRGRKLSTILVRCVMRDRRLAAVAFVPGKIEGNGPPTYFRPADAPDVVNHVLEISEPFGTRFDVRDEEVAVILESAEPRITALEYLTTQPRLFAWRRATGL